MAKKLQVYSCTSACSYHGSEGCKYLGRDLPGEQQRTEPLPTDGICIHPQVHEKPLRRLEQQLKALRI